MGPTDNLRRVSIKLQLLAVKPLQFRPFYVRPCFSLTSLYRELLNDRIDAINFSFRYFLLYLPPNDTKDDRYKFTCFRIDNFY